MIERPGRYRGHTRLLRNEGCEAARIAGQRKSYDDGQIMAINTKRLAPTPATLRSLYVASGGVCEMTGCNKRLTRGSGAWIGTVAHIVSAEDGGPRSDKSMDPNDRRRASNLMLLCADHGREVDDPVSGEREFPRAKLEQIKSAHEMRFAHLVDDMIASSKNRPPVVDDFLDRSVRNSLAGGSCDAYARFLDEGQGTPAELAELTKTVCRQLARSRELLSDLSEAALGTLAALLDLWQRSLDRDDVGTVDYGDPWAWGAAAEVHVTAVRNRERVQSGLSSALGELELRQIVAGPPEDVFDISENTYSIRSPWAREWATWPRIDRFLQEQHAMTAAEWVSTLDYSVFD